MTSVTLIGTKLAKSGAEFIFVGAASDCEACKLKNSCVNLEPGRKYRILSVRNEATHECPIHDSGVVAAEVAEAAVSATVDARRAFEGSKFFFEAPRCDHNDCIVRELCFPVGLKRGDRLTITKIVGEPDGGCALDRNLRVVEVRK
jgi:hypothetical protein